MNLYFKLSVFAIVLCLQLVESAPQKKKDSQQCDKNVFDTCADRLLMLGDKTFKFPESIEAMNSRCKEVKVKESCTKDFSKNCLRGDTKNSISVLTVSVLKKFV